MWKNNASLFIKYSFHTICTLVHKYRLFETSWSQYTPELWYFVALTLAFCYCFCWFHSLILIDVIGRPVGTTEFFDTFPDSSNACAFGPIRLNKTGKNTRPWKRPKVTTRKNILKNVLKMYDLKIKEIIRKLIILSRNMYYRPMTFGFTSSRLKWRHSHCAFRLFLFKWHAREKKRRERNEFPISKGL